MLYPSPAAPAPPSPPWRASRQACSRSRDRSARGIARQTTSCGAVEGTGKDLEHIGDTR